jgi:flagellin-like hook-associated protein FlgL
MINSVGYKGTAIGDPLKPVSMKPQQPIDQTAAAKSYSVTAAKQASIKNNLSVNSPAAFYTQTESAPIVNNLYNAQAGLVNSPAANQNQIVNLNNGNNGTGGSDVNSTKTMFVGGGEDNTVLVSGLDVREHLDWIIAMVENGKKHQDQGITVNVNSDKSQDQNIAVMTDASALANQSVAGLDVNSATMTVGSMIDRSKFEFRSELLWSASNAYERLQIMKQYPIGWTLTDNNYGSLGIAFSDDNYAKSQALAKNQISTQAGTSILAQANQSPGSVLNLLV